MWKMGELRNRTIRRMLDGGYDFWLSIDTDIVVDPWTLYRLLAADKDFRIILPELDNMSVHFFGKIPAAVQCSQFQRRNGKGIIKYIFFRHFGPPGVM